MKFAAFVLLLVAFPGFLWAAPKSRRSLNLPKSAVVGYDQKDVVNAHNKYRGRAGSSDMKYMTWDQELADAAQAHVDKCVFQHGTLAWPGMSFNTVGQNMFYINSRSMYPSYIVSKFYNEISYYDYDTNTCQPGKVCGHYLQVMWANTDKVGCGKKVCDSMFIVSENRNVSNAAFFTCNYNPAALSYLQKPFKKGVECTRCTSGKQWCYDGLCIDSCDGEDSDECECYAECENCGVANEDDCSCKCPDGYLGTACESECSDLSPHCGTTWPSWTCSMPAAKDLVGPKCPKMCGLCKPPTIDTKTCTNPTKRGFIKLLKDLQNMERSRRMQERTLKD